MTALALLIVLLSAFLHAFWNLLVKRANGGQPLMWLIFVFMVAVSVPVGAYILITQRPVIGTPEIIAMVGNGILQMTYFYLLSQSYRFGDLSLTYPLARGSGPLVVTIYAMLFLGEKPSALALGGAVLITLGVLLLSANLKELRESGALKGVAYALLTGACIAFYTLWDRHSVRDLRLNPFMYLAVGSVVQMLIVTPYALRNWDRVSEQWGLHKVSAASVAVLSFVAYGLILFALTFSPVSYIAPAREISVLIGAVMGSQVLAEAVTTRRIAAAVAMVAGLICLAVG
jgi:drug/metabolite transporter (DMT)-like permease